jgi:hypothetical protein
MQVAAPRPLETLPSLFGRLEGRGAWALEKVRELVTISNDPNRPAKDRESARRGARRITLDLAKSVGLTPKPEEIDGTTNPLLARIDGWGGRSDQTATSTTTGVVRTYKPAHVQTPSSSQSLQQEQTSNNLSGSESDLPSYDHEITFESLEELRAQT